MVNHYETNDNIVLDIKTGLEWQAETAGEMSWYKAMEYAESLGNDWRLLTVEELSTLIDCNKVDPATTFPGHRSAAFWSSSVLAVNPSYAWYMYFYYGHVHVSYKSLSNYARCVRGRL